MSKCVSQCIRSPGILKTTLINLGETPYDFFFLIGITSLLKLDSSRDKFLHRFSKVLHKYFKKINLATLSKVFNNHNLGKNMEQQ